MRRLPLDDAKAALFDECNPLQQNEKGLSDEVEEQYRRADGPRRLGPIREERVVSLRDSYRELWDLFGHVFTAGMGPSWLKWKALTSTRCAPPQARVITQRHARLRGQKR